MLTQKEIRRRHYVKNRSSILESHRARWRVKRDDPVWMEQQRGAQKENYYKNHKDRRDKQKQYRYSRPAAVCRWERRKRVKSYGITLAQFRELWRKQKHKCAICKVRFSVTVKNRLIHIDHRHDATGKVRGLLCGLCNVGLGNFKDSPDRLIEAIVYLERTNA